MSPKMPATQQGRAVSQKDLPPSVEKAYLQKCIQLRRRINDIEENNDVTRLRIKRLNRAITKLRLERAFLLQQLQDRMEYNVDDSDRSSSPPPTPTDKPLRSKRSHRKTTPPGGGVSSSNLGPRGNASPQHQVLQPLNPLSSAQSTPDPGRTNSFFTPIPTSAASPSGVNGNSHNVLPPLSQLPSLQPSHGRVPFDTAYDDRRSVENDASPNGRRRAHSSAQRAESANGERRSQDTEMVDAPGLGGFTAVNR